MSDAYNNPEHFGLVILKEYDVGGSYEFDKFVFWKRLLDGQVFYAEDSGCSCPSPFENLNGFEGLIPLGDGERERHEAAFKTWTEDYDKSPKIDVDLVMEGMKIIGDYYREKEAGVKKEKA